MAFFNSLENIKPLRIDDTPEDSPVRRILETIEHTGLDLRHFMLVGSAALSLYGIELPTFDKKPRPGDVDLASTADAFGNLLNAGKSPAGDPVLYEDPGTYHSQHTLLIDTQAANPNLLPVDIITRFRPLRDDPNRFDAAFRNSLRKPGSTHEIPDVKGLRVASLERIKRELDNHSVLNPKVQEDLQAIRQFSHNRKSSRRVA